MQHKERTKLKIQTEATPRNCVPKDVSLLLKGTTNVPKIPQTYVLGLHQQHHRDQNSLAF